MPWYNDLRPRSDSTRKDYALIFPQMTPEEKIRTIEGLQRLRAGLDEKVNFRKTEYNLVVATWNIKEFGHTTQRLPETYFYIAEILNRFDLIAIQEVKSSLHDLDIIMRILGGDWSYVVNDITEGSAGNRERSAYLFNKKRVKLSGLVGEIVLWEELTLNSQVKQLKRTPYITGFRAGWKDFSLINLHLQPGDTADKPAYRQEEVRLLITALKEKILRKSLWTDKLVLLGDFNLYQDNDTDLASVKMLEDHGYTESPGLKGKDTTTSRSQAYDRMFFYDHKYFRIAQEGGTEAGDVFFPFDFVFRLADRTIYKPYMVEDYTGSGDLDDDDKLETYFDHYWKRNQLSDHLPIWTELIIDSSDEFLADKLKAIREEG